MLKKSNGPCGDNILLTRSTMWHFGGTVGKKQFSTIPILYNYMLMNQLVNLTQHFVDFDGGGARSTTLIATEHFVDPKKWLHSFGNPYQIVHFYSKHLEKNNQLFTRLSRFFSSFGGSHVKERKSKVNGFTYYREPTNGCRQKAHVDRQSLFSHALLFCLTCQEESSVKKFFLQNL